SETKYKACPLRLRYGMLREGETRYSSGTNPTDYTYTGQYSYTSDFGLMFYNARWYDSSLSRFAQADTIVPGGIQALDRYAYVNNSPVMYIDPSGHIAVPLPLVLIGLAGLTLFVYIIVVPPEVRWENAENAARAIEDLVESLKQPHTSPMDSDIEVDNTFTFPLEDSDTSDNTFSFPLNSSNEELSIMSSSTDVSDLLMPDGQPVGNPGYRENVQEMEDDEILDLWGKLSENGTVINYPGYNGEVIELESGEIVGLRDSKKYGPTIDILKGANIPYDKIHRPR
ncbi:MAG: RHS repeat-associated core domain-containing protein, partial [Anaerolineales bacterium]|nr:RHS repeat-associated core domain-containing protein [Anaerolineales bacterium]